MSSKSKVLVLGSHRIRLVSYNRFYFQGISNTPPPSGHRIRFTWTLYTVYIFIQPLWHYHIFIRPLSKFSYKYLYPPALLFHFKNRFRIFINLCYKLVYFRKDDNLTICSCTELPKKVETVKTALNCLNITIPRLSKVLDIICLRLSWWIGNERNKFILAGNQKFKETGSINSVQSSLKSHPLRVTLYEVITLK